ncbi:hypothetical protein MHYP_G00203570 [Metynnis hypsauchen]
MKHTRIPEKSRPPALAIGYCATHTSNARIGRPGRRPHQAATVQSPSALESQQSGYSVEHNRAPTTKPRFTLRTFKTLKQPFLVRGSSAGVESRLLTHLYCAKLISREAPAVRRLPTLSSGCSALSRPERVALARPPWRGGPAALSGASYFTVNTRTEAQTENSGLEVRRSHLRHLHTNYANYCFLRFPSVWRP